MQEIKVWAVPAGYCGESAGSTNVVAMVKRSDYESAIREAEEKAYMLAMKDIKGAKSEARKQGAEEAAREVVEYLEAGGKLKDCRYVFSIKARGAAKPCKCYTPLNHPDNCACGCHHHPEPVCTCAWVGDHHPDCPCYKPPEPAPLEKVVLDGDGYCNDRTWAVKFNALIERVNRIEARG